MILLTQTNPTSVADDIFDSFSSSIRGLGKNIGNTKSTVPMRLPNGLEPIIIPTDKIAEQIVYMESDGNTSQIQCLNPSMLNAQVLDSKLIGQGDYEAVFPKGGPKQRTWLDIKNENGTLLSQTFKVSNVIEIGILDINRTVETGIKKVNDIDLGFK
jgi:hypothetical protein